MNRGSPSAENTDNSSKGLNSIFLDRILKADDGTDLGIIKDVQERPNVTPLFTLETQGGLFTMRIPLDQIKTENDGTLKIKQQYSQVYIWGLRSKQEQRQIWKALDEKFKETLESAKETFTINKNVNVILVIIGVVLITNSIIYTWIKGIDGFSLFSGGIGIASVVSLFFYRPQLKINKALEILASVDMAYKSHYLTLESISDYNTLHTYNRDFDDLKSMNELLSATTLSYVQMIGNTIKDGDSSGP